MHNMEWLPLTEYALRSGISISTLRRKIKSNTIDYKMEEGRYLVRFESDEKPKVHKFISDDRPIAPKPQKIAKETKKTEPVVSINVQEVNKVSVPEGLASGSPTSNQRVALIESDLKWRALEARVSGMAKKMDFLSEQLAELKMLVKIFEERLDQDKF
ncbi:MAG: hypothetical protein M9962_04935 [Oligoflexia bacterium]|nr:hypothetical protein [Oligoflexia bacterium]